MFKTKQNKKALAKGTLTEETWNFENNKWDMDGDEYMSKKKMKGRKLEDS